MTPAELIQAFDIPGQAMVNQRVPKKMLSDQVANSAADRKLILDGIEAIHWLAALKPATVGVSEYHDSARDYLEIAVVTAELRPAANASRALLLIHRAIPYPLLLVCEQAQTVSLSLAHKRKALNQAEAVVIDGPAISVKFSSSDSTSGSIIGQANPLAELLARLSLAANPRQHLFALYQSWIDRLETYQAALLTGRFELPQNESHAGLRRHALARLDEIAAEVQGLRSKAAKERMTSRRVDLNLSIQRLEAESALLRQNL